MKMFVIHAVSVIIEHQEKIDLIPTSRLNMKVFCILVKNVTIPQDQKAPSGDIYG